MLKIVGTNKRGGVESERVLITDDDTALALAATITEQ